MPKVQFNRKRKFLIIDNINTDPQCIVWNFHVHVLPSDYILDNYISV